MMRKDYKKLISFICMFILSISLLSTHTVKAETINDVIVETEDNLTLENEDISNEAELAANKEIVLFHTNDTHSRVDAFPKMKSYVNGFAGNSLLLDAGDTFHGQSFATLENGSSIAKILNAMGYAAMVPGNHDFNYGQDILRTLGGEANLPLLAVNVKKNGVVAYDDVVIKEVNGVKVGILGIATPETAYKTNPLNVVGLDFGTKESIIADAQAAVDALKTQGANVIVALSHLGIDPTSDVKATDIAEAVTGIDVMIDGHSHSTLDKYEEFNAAHKTKITSTGNYLESFGEVRISLDNENNVLDVKPGNVLTKNLTEEDAEIKGLIDGIKKGQEPILNEIVGETPIDLDGVRENVRSGHTNLGRLITSAMLDETGADIAITNGGGIRDSIKAGQITKGNVIAVLPFGNYIVTKNVTGQDIIDALNATMAKLNGGFPHFAGMNVLTEEYIDEAGKTRWRVVSIEVNGSPIDAEKMYTLATNDFMAAGGDNYTMFGNYPTLNEYSALDEALIKYISKVGAKGIIAIDSEVRLAEAELVEMEALKERLTEAIKAEFKVELIKYSEDKTLVVLTKDSERKEFLVNGALASAEAVLEEVNKELNGGDQVPPTDEPSVDVKPEDGTGNGSGAGSGSSNGNSSNSGSGTGTEPGKGNSTLPETGGTNPMVPAALGVIIILAGVVVLKKKNKTA
ncbi:Trifunctional nucleotide phosphoesterase protein YfkN precursor [uncultured Clostridium sp.]|uniref:5'-nucleotidase C-terminal domain-containing protein n=1 Tax=uncultured Clostridium sp. TaxID=59620 RepID=UPI0008207C83|nr:5'-nucleotidase C-terminal domain-containing protein [uncultured Clostridium sp.]SCJ38074.1 Trifunctional nucleotide phosphoesterase protein YfkN precursor [uncultured Clostridium sp.]